MTTVCPPEELALTGEPRGNGKGLFVAFFFSLRDVTEGHMGARQCSWKGRHSSSVACHRAPSKDFNYHSVER